MKTSFYFVVWILIYPFLHLFNNSFIDNNSFLVALGCVIGLSWMVNHLMPETLNYGRASEIARILEKVYTGNVKAFAKQLSNITIIETIGVLYFLATMAVILIEMFMFGGNDWFGLFVFGFLAIRTIARTFQYNKARVSLEKNPTPEKCMEIACNTYKLDYASYYEEREYKPYADILPPQPRFYKVFLVISIIFASIATLLGLFLMLTSFLMMINFAAVIVGTLAGMYFLYGSLAAYFGIKDIISIIQLFKEIRQPRYQETALEA